jgi:3-hydroxybutyryl-CoA dehydratase
VTGLVPLRVGDQVRFGHQVTEADVYLFAAVTGDSNEDHVDATSPVARQHGRIAHGAYLVSLMATAGALIHQRHDVPSVSAGYDRIRFVRPVPIGTQVEVRYQIDRVDERRGRAEAAIEIANADGTVVAVGRHLIAFMTAEGTPPQKQQEDDDDGA